MAAWNMFGHDLAFGMAGTPVDRLDERVITIFTNIVKFISLDPRECKAGVKAWVEESTGKKQ